jgi:hypothetical protein
MLLIFTCLGNTYVVGRYLNCAVEVGIVAVSQGNTLLCENSVNKMVGNKGVFYTEVHLFNLLSVS